MDKHSEIAIESYSAMAADQQRELEAEEWSEALINDAFLSDPSAEMPSTP